MIPVDLSIIIISYNTKAITLQCLKSITKSLDNKQLKYEIIIVDNASTDGTADYLLNQLKSARLVSQSKRVKIRLIKNKMNVGFAKANNQAVKQANGKYILFLNSDIIVLDDAINQLYSFYRKNADNIHFLGGKLLNNDHSPQPSCGPFYSLGIVFGALFLRGDYWGLTRYSPDKLKKVDWISGACILTKSKYFNDVGGFDEKIFMYMDEIDLLYRAQKKGYSTYFYPKSQFIHLGSASSRSKTYPIIQVYQGFLYFYKKHCTRLEQFLLKIMLKLKASIAILIGRVINNNYLIDTYEKACQLTSMD